MKLNKRLNPIKKVNGKIKFSSFGKSLNYENAKKFLKNRTPKELLRYYHEKKK